MKRILHSIVFLFALFFALIFSDSASAESVNIGDCILLGNILQESLHGTVRGGAPIEWLVLDKEDSKVLLISRAAIANQPYGGDNWENCTLRTWLNDDFYNSAFSEKEKDVIIPSVASAEVNPYFDSNQGRDTVDNIFLLSANQVKKYFPTMDARSCVATAYVNGEGAYQGQNGNCIWLLRTTGFLSVTTVSSFGVIDYYGKSCNDEKLCVRPAMWVDTDSDAWREVAENKRSLDEPYVAAITSMHMGEMDVVHRSAFENSGAEGNDSILAENGESVQKQIRLIYESMNMWNIDSPVHLVMYSVTDFDKNGRLEIVAAENYSSGNYTNFRIWEVNESFNGLNDLGSGIDTNFMLTYGDIDNEILRNDICAPDVLPAMFTMLVREPITETTAYSLPTEDRIYYIFLNSSGGNESWEQIQECLFLNKGELKIFPVVWRCVGGFGGSLSRYYDWQGNIIGPQQYEDVDSFFTGYSKQKVQLYWIYGSVCSPETLEESYNVFSMTW